MQAYKKLFVFAFLMVWQTVGWGQNEFPIGFYTSGNNNTTQGLTQMDSTNATWIQAYGQNGPSPDDVSINTTVLQNTQGLKVIAVRFWNILIPSRSQRMVFDAERTTDGGGL